MPDLGSLLIAQVSARPLDEPGHDAGAHAQLLANGLVQRGHRVLLVAPSQDRTAIRQTQALLEGDPEAFLPQPGDPPRVLAIGEATHPMRAGRREGVVPIDVTRAFEQLFEHAPIDLCHLHDPLPPSVPFAALKASGALNVGSFHASPARLLKAPMTRKLREQRFGRLDARLATSNAVAREVEELLGVSVTPVALGVEAGKRAARAAGEPLRIALVEQEERSALRGLLRALRALPAELEWEARIVSAKGPSARSPLAPELASRISFSEPAGEQSELELWRWADVAVFGSDGSEPAPNALLRAIVCGAVPVATRLSVYTELIGEDERGLRVDLRDPENLAAAILRLDGDRQLLARLSAAAGQIRSEQRPSAVLDDVLRVYESLLARRHDPAVPPAMARRLADRPLVDVDLHMHTDHSGDCVTPVEVLLRTAKERGLGVIAVTDHDEISGALEAAELADQFGIKVIVGEEVKSAGEGEVIGLFLTEKIPGGMTLRETIAEIKRQGGVVYVPHPFDRMHSVPDYFHLLDVLDDIDALEIFNPRVAVGSFNDEARRFASKYRIAMAAGSDAHVPQGLGSVRTRMPDFDGPEEFKAALRFATVQPRPASLIYVQALKFLESKATPAAARRARRERRVRKATRG